MEAVALGISGVFIAGLIFSIAVRLRVDMTEQGDIVIYFWWRGTRREFVI